MKVRVEMIVEYAESDDVVSAEDVLQGEIYSAIQRGLLTGEADLEVSEYTFTVDEVTEDVELAIADKRRADRAEKECADLRAKLASETLEHSHTKSHLAHADDRMKMAREAARKGALEEVLEHL